MDSNQENDVRQQRLSLTWHGTNEGGSYKELAGETEPAKPKPQSGGLKILKRPAILPAEDPAPVAEPEAVCENEELPEEMFVHAAEELADLQKKTPDEDETVVVKAPEPPDVTATDELEAVLDEVLDEVVEVTPEELETVVAETPAIADVPLVADLAADGDDTTEQKLQDITATATLTVDGDQQDDPVVKDEITCSQLLRSGVTTVADMNSDDLDQDEGATATIPAITPAGVNEEFTTEMEIMPEEKPTPKLLLSKTGQHSDRPKPALTVDHDDQDMTNRLKVRKAPAIKTIHTSKMRPDTQEVIGGAPLGEKLRLAREASQMDLFEVAEKTRISSEYISALEEERFEGLPLAAIYIKSYLKTLARCYGIDPDELIAEYEERTGADRQNEERARAQAKAKESSDKESDSRNVRWINWAIGAVAAIVIVVLIAGVFIHQRVGGLSAEDLTIVNDSELREMITQEFLPYRERSIPTNETAAVRNP